MAFGFWLLAFSDWGFWAVLIRRFKSNERGDIICMAWFVRASLPTVHGEICIGWNLECDRKPIMPGPKIDCTGIPASACMERPLSNCEYRLDSMGHELLLKDSSTQTSISLVHRTDQTVTELT